MAHRFAKCLAAAVQMTRWRQSLKQPFLQMPCYLACRSDSSNQPDALRSIMISEWKWQCMSIVETV